ncbi:TPA: helix-turn-helix transcriptional regulator [Candidatus Scatousia excrementigallinarum]|uniref:Helix-turn-helix transcriptional regulator n=1 Tax=Candidatus Scatousia excrementigallinarum TaxID=2840935 RepID=A0A9D1JMU9_9BACT|nr:helix-turn-helix transcriptional regulator [Candidatus Scatousia excrementigallinarum]
MNTKELLGLKVKEFRKQQKLTQEKLAEIIGVDNGYISKLEVGQNFPSISTLEKIATALNIELYELFQFTKGKDKDFKQEIISIYDNLNKEKQYTLYRVAKAMK